MTFKTVFVAELPDLISPHEYADDPQGGQIKLRIRVTAHGLEVLADAMRPAELEKLFDHLGVREVEQMLCG